MGHLTQHGYCINIPTVVSVGFNQTGYTASEENCFIAVNISLNGSAALPLTFNLTTTSGLAMAGQDFVRVSRTPVTINPGTRSSQASIMLINDNEVEMTVESFAVTLEANSGSVPQGVRMTNNLSTIYIQDDDSALGESKYVGYTPRCW